MRVAAADPERARADRAQDRMGAGRGGEPPRRGRRAARSTPSAARRRSRSRGWRRSISACRSSSTAAACSCARSRSSRGSPDLKGKRIAVIAGTTTEQALVRGAQRRRARRATLVPVKTAPRAWRCSTTRKVDGYAGDRVVLADLKLRAPKPDAFDVRRRRFFVRAVRARRAARRSRFPARGEPRAGRRSTAPATSTRSSSAGSARSASPGRCCTRCSTSTRCRSEPMNRRFAADVALARSSRRGRGGARRCAVAAADPQSRSKAAATAPPTARRFPCGRVDVDPADDGQAAVDAARRRAPSFDQRRARRPRRSRSARASRTRAS